MYNVLHIGWCTDIMSVLVRILTVTSEKRVNKPHIGALVYVFYSFFFIIYTLEEIQVPLHIIVWLTVLWR